MYDCNQYNMIITIIRRHASQIKYISSSYITQDDIQMPMRVSNQVLLQGNATRNWHKHRTDASPLLPSMQFAMLTSQEKFQCTVSDG